MLYYACYINQYYLHVDSADSAITADLYIKHETGLIHQHQISDGCIGLIVGSCPYQNNQLMTHRGSFPVNGNPGKAFYIFLEYKSKFWPNHQLIFCAQIEFLLI